ncbi:ATP-dependent Clp protease proteolytic subunit [bacterium (Candidatus Blackallbacteria) CG17_big_fil_post_rev_8_21_14_2_50_48_46]|uniref:ATP-dependent Clp protease proteolytic subunit n=1 Tax=bacterium (Candidatus Blackallbacteria) CG17_big_fil_post_rev_8_21_14_2_50_48_46 TaxID=2014261 RepID=A0A2M7G2H9_9BACT|nr:MAG: ATP-dependent Clp protease proteolytic subunit [bacterium (Candidatus Blackallbacteria) CG18_big_fil_WC_8_21_14_2_50_49_26]PIW15588.1 MAG: ATP-dependent Clp protease proteolytic subunit [bacterium (Candidatus Blackallbacteria) CG17_big_fil_post_rev_8_21_14_2_50_48_46]PIW49379.1 MAG: ATP-dependent Clp protease proteolytic subunit [bacterium (Candidatus Blackallbacteria) CG13_big_fil_rev_8_21_14_2_50_49_14]
MIRFEEDDEDDEKSPVKDLLENLSEARLFQKKFLEKRKVFLWGPVMDASARDVVNRLMYLEAEKPGEEITLYINSPGGVVTSGMVIYDTIKMITSPVSTVCMGLAASMGSILLSVGAKGRRFIYPSGRVMIHQPSIGGLIQGAAADIAIHAKEIVKTKEMGARILAENCDQPFEKIMKDFDRDYWMDAKESLEYGIVDGLLDKIDL